ncbi:MAG: RNA 2',3'-cyclic phosphodiesterase [Robiginitomaculum sp.]|nr:MAG: RNA 2',3'-cyclic phosphodiesterase [Robiginitomaculum sp.]
MTDMLTLFAAIKPPPHILRDIDALQKGIDGVRWAYEDNLHITLGYFGLVSTEFAEILDHELARGAGGGFKLKLSSVDVFGGSRPHTLWLGLEENKALSALHKHVRSAARRAHVEMETRKFTPHLSLAYMHDGVDLGDLSRFIRKNLSYKSKPFIVDQFALYSSHPQKTGPNIYQSEANYPLLGQ